MVVLGVSGSGGAAGGLLEWAVEWRASQGIGLPVQESSKACGLIPYNWVVVSQGGHPWGGLGRPLEPLGPLGGLYWRNGGAQEQRIASPTDYKVSGALVDSPVRN